MSLTGLDHLHDAPDIINVVSPVLIVDVDEVLIYLQMERPTFANNLRNDRIDRIP